MKEAIFEAIKRFEKIIIHRHVRPDPDAYGSQGGLARMLEASFPDKEIYAVGEQEPTLDYLFVPDQIADDVYEGALVIVCDTANEERVCDPRYRMGDLLIKIDHHPNEDPYGDILWVDTKASSVSEMIFDFYLSFRSAGLKMTTESARLIFAGIVGDTNRFLYPSTTERTLQFASELVGFGFDTARLFDEMYELDPDLMKLQGHVLQHFVMDENGAAVVKLDKGTLKAFDVNSQQASLLVSSLGNMKGIKAWVFLIEEKDQIRVRLRSKGPVINTIAMKYNGGGHPLAAGASVYSWEEAERVVRDIRHVCEVE